MYTCEHHLCNRGLQRACEGEVECLFEGGCEYEGDGDVTMKTNVNVNARVQVNVKADVTSKADVEVAVKSIQFQSVALCHFNQSLYSNSNGNNQRITSASSAQSAQLQRLSSAVAQCVVHL